MSAVEAYLADLRAALGNRLPPSVTAARLRETRSHLLASARDVGEEEAMRRYGRARAVANGLVRAQRGYGERSAWALARPLVASFLVLAAVTALQATRPSVVWLTHVVERLTEPTLLLVALGFLLRVVQTRRWLAGSMEAAHAACLLVCALPHFLSAAASRWNVADIPIMALWVGVCGLFWSALNGVGLGMGLLLDRRKVRRPTRAR